jgi:hypothetical protein
VNRSLPIPARKLIHGPLATLYLFCCLNAHSTGLNNAVRRLPVESYPKLPSKIAVILHSRGCNIRQVSQGRQAQNVIQGEFFRKGEKGWAVLCSITGKSLILVFRNEHDTSPYAIGESRDDQFIMDTGHGAKVYLREISSVDRKFILHYYHVYGGPKPPQIDHNGIEDSFLEKASVVWYWYGENGSSSRGRTEPPSLRGKAKCGAALNAPRSAIES